MNKLSPEQVSKLSDENLTKGIAEFVYPKNGWDIYRNNSKIDPDTYIRYEDSSHYEQVDYCNNWNDLMPLIIEYRIELREGTRTNGWKAFHRGIGVVISNDTPQRALAECVLLVLQDKDKYKE